MHGVLDKEAPGSGVIGGIESDPYAKLVETLNGAFEQAATGKGRERHADAEPWEKQVTAEIARRLKGSPVAGPLQQVIKKTYESIRLERQAAIAELYGSIIYSATAVMLLSEMSDEEYSVYLRGIREAMLLSGL